MQVVTVLTTVPQFTQASTAVSSSRSPLLALQCRVVTQKAAGGERGSDGWHEIPFLLQLSLPW